MRLHYFSIKAVFGVVLIVLALLFLWFNFKDSKNKNIQPSSTKIMPAIKDAHSTVVYVKPLVIQDDKKLIEQFPEALRTQAHEVLKKSVLADVEMDGAIHFQNEELVLDLDLRRRIDAYLLLYPELDFEGIRYLMSQENVFSESDNPQQENARFKQLDKVFSAYVELQQSIQKKAIKPSTDVDFENILDQLSVLRKEVLGEKLAEAFFAKEEEYIRQRIPNGVIQMPDFRNNEL